MADTVSAGAAGALHALGPHHLPAFIPGADGSDWLMTVVLWFLIVMAVVGGTLYLSLHSLPERLAHGKDAAHFELVAVLGLLALFTHNNIFWVAALILAFLRLPDFETPLVSIASSLKRLGSTAAVEPEQGETEQGETGFAAPGQDAPVNMASAETQALPGDTGGGKRHHAEEGS
jgi:hypothetical protein